MYFVLFKRSYTRVWVRVRVHVRVCLYVIIRNTTQIFQTLFVDLYKKNVLYMARLNYLSVIKLHFQYVTGQIGDFTLPFVLHGASGSGKTCLLAKAFCMVST